MANRLLTIATLFVSAVLLHGCVGYYDDANRSLDYDRLVIAFQAKLPGNYALSPDKHFGVFGTCTRNGETEVSMSKAKVSDYAHADGSPAYFFKTSDEDALWAEKGDHGYKFYAYYPYNPSCEDLAAIPMEIPSKVNWTRDGERPQTMIVSKTEVTSIIAPVQMKFEAAPICLLTIRIPDYACKVIKKLRIHAGSEASFKSCLAYSGTYDIFTGKATRTTSTESKSIEVDFGSSGYTLENGYTDVVVLMNPVSYPSGGLKMTITDGDNVETVVSMFNAKKVFSAGSETTFVMP